MSESKNDTMDARTAHYQVQREKMSPLLEWLEENGASGPYHIQQDFIEGRCIYIITGLFDTDFSDAHGELSIAVQKTLDHLKTNTLLRNKPEQTGRHSIMGSLGSS